MPNLGLLSENKQRPSLFRNSKMFLTNRDESRPSFFFVKLPHDIYRGLRQGAPFLYTRRIGWGWG